MLVKIKVVAGRISRRSGKVVHPWVASDLLVVGVVLAISVRKSRFCAILGGLWGRENSHRFDVKFNFLAFLHSTHS